MGSRHVKEGAGWRLGWAPDEAHYQALIGGDGWAIELTEPEFHDFCRLAQQLADTMLSMQAELMDEERLAIEAESPRLWLEAEGFPQHYSLRVLVLGGRRCEGQWAAEAVPALLQAIPALMVF